MSEIYIRNISSYPLNVGGSNFYGSSVGHQTPAIVNGEFHYRSNVNGVYVCWAQGGVRYCAKGIDSGSTTESANSVWVPSGSPSSLRFSNGSRQFRIDQVRIQNNVSNATITVFENSNFTGSLGSLGFSSTGTFPYRQNYYLSITGLGVNPESTTRTINNSASGHTYRVDGAHQSGVFSQYTCDCTLSEIRDGGSCFPTSRTCNVEPGGQCSPGSEGFICLRTCETFGGGPDPNVVTTSEYKCRSTEISSETFGFFNPSPSIILLP